MDFKGKIFLAPMAGITETVFRRLCKDNGADIVMSEMVSAEGIFYKSKSTRALLDFKESERPIGIQLFGSNPSHIAYAASYVEEHFRPDFIDLNSGCPIAKVVKKNGGAALLRDRGLFQKIVSGMVRSVSVPITVKLRSGWQATDQVDTAFASIAQDCGAAAIILHPRTRAMFFSGHSLWERIALVKQAVSIPVIGNGDICTAADAQSMIEQTKCDSIMIGRATLGNPWIFSSIKRRSSDSGNDTAAYVKRADVMARHMKEFCEHYGEKKAMNELKKHIVWYCRGVPKAAALRKEIFSAKTFTMLEEIVRNSYEKNEGTDVFH